MKQRKASSAALWIPGAWLVLLGSRPVSYWLSHFGIQSGATSALEGNPIDIWIFLALILGAVVVLVRRGFAWGSFARMNKALILIYAYLAVSAVWADYSVPTLKRAIKDFGSVLVALVLLTERDPVGAIRTVFVRVSYLLFPLSVVFIKYFPDIGRTPSRGGENLFCGVCEHKSGLGVMVFVIGQLILFDLLEMRRERGARMQRTEEWIRYGMVGMCFWLLSTCNSASALISFVLGCLILWGTTRSLRLGNPKRMVVRGLAVLVGVALVETTFDASTAILEALGRSPSLTGRTLIWELAKEAQHHPLLGTGYYSFWDTAGAEMIIERWGGALRTTHNGYLEMYLDGGLVGVGLLILLLLVWGRRSVKRMLGGSLFGRMTLMFWVLAVIFNNSEALFFRLNPLWFTLLLTMIECPFPARSAEVVPVLPTDDTGTLARDWQTNLSTSNAGGTAVHA